YVTPRNFGREEALFALSVLDRVFGRSFFSRRRLGWAAALVVVPFTPIILAAIFSAHIDHVSTWLLLAGFLSFGMVGFLTSVAITRFLTSRLLPHMVTSGRGLVLSAVLLILQLVILLYGSPIFKKTGFWLLLHLWSYAWVETPLPSAWDVY